MRRVLHWSVWLWVAPVATIALWMASLLHRPLMSSGFWVPAFFLIVGGSLVSFLVAAVYLLTRYWEPWAAVAVVVNLAGQAFNGFACLLGMAGAYS